MYSKFVVSNIRFNTFFVNLRFNDKNKVSDDTLNVCQLVEQKKIRWYEKLLKNYSSLI